MALRTSALRLAAQPRAHCGATSLLRRPPIHLIPLSARSFAMGGVDLSKRARFCVEGRSPTEVLVSRRYILANYRKHLPERLDTERTQPPAAWIAVTPKHVDVARQILEAKHWIVPYSSARSAPAAALPTAARSFEAPPRSI